MRKKYGSLENFLFYSLSHIVLQIHGHNDQTFFRTVEYLCVMKLLQIVNDETILRWYGLIMLSTLQRFRNFTYLTGMRDKPLSQLMHTLAYSQIFKCSIGTYYRGLTVPVVEVFRLTTIWSSSNAEFLFIRWKLFEHSANAHSNGECTNAEVRIRYLYPY